MEVNEENTQTYLVPSVAALGLQGTTIEKKLEGTHDLDILLIMVIVFI